jgi:hypothetical protein
LHEFCTNSWTATQEAASRRARVWRGLLAGTVVVMMLCAVTIAVMVLTKR